MLFAFHRHSARSVEERQNTPRKTANANAIGILAVLRRVFRQVLRSTTDKIAVVKIAYRYV